MVNRRYGPAKGSILTNGLVLSSTLSSLIAIGGCAPTVKIQAPDRPIEINLNVKIDQEVRVRLDKDIEDLLSENPDIF